MLLSRTARRGGRKAAHHTAQMWQFRDCDSGSSIARDSRRIMSRLCHYYESFNCLHFPLYDTHNRVACFVQ